MGCPKKLLEGKEYHATLLYTVLKHFPQQIQLSLPQVLRSKGFTDVKSNNPGLQKRVQQGAAGCTEIHEKAIQAVIDAAAAIAQITAHTGGLTNIPNAIVTNADTSTVSSLLDSSPTTNSNCKRSNNSRGSIKRVKKTRLTAHQAQQERNNNMLGKERKNKAFKLATP